MLRRWPVIKRPSFRSNGGCRRSVRGTGRPGLASTLGQRPESRFLGDLILGRVSGHCTLSGSGLACPWRSDWSSRKVGGAPAKSLSSFVFFFFFWGGGGLAKSVGLGFQPLTLKGWRTAGCASCPNVQRPKLHLGCTRRVVRSLAERSGGFGLSHGKTLNPKP